MMTSTGSCPSLPPRMTAKSGIVMPEFRMKGGLSGICTHVMEMPAFTHGRPSRPTGMTFTFVLYGEDNLPFPWSLRVEDSMVWMSGQFTPLLLSRLLDPRPGKPFPGKTEPPSCRPPPRNRQNSDHISALPLPGWHSVNSGDVK